MKHYLSLITLLLLSLSMQAQDDVYFVPKPKPQPRSTYYSGCQRSVDEYNRRPIHSYITPIDTAMSDVITFDSIVGSYPDSLLSLHSDTVRIASYEASDDYLCTRRMKRFDDYQWEEPYRVGYYDGFADGFHRSAWYPYWDWGYSSWYWDWPYRYGWCGYWGYSWYGPHYHYGCYPGWVGVSYRPIRGGVPGTRNHSTQRTQSSRNTRQYAGYRGNHSSQNVRQPSTFNNPSSSFGGSRGGSFSGGSRGGNFSGGGSRSGSGFGGRR
ncbi:MAG: hypothetical protein SPI57_09110 [Prevotella sp.]|nr:hypothetical protein [Prevotella sp.]